MSLTVQNIVDAARVKHPRWYTLTQPHGPILHHMDTVQTELFNDALAYDSKFMAQRLGILVKASAFADFAGTASGGTPAVDVDPTGTMLELARSTVHDSGVPSSATSTTLVDSSKSWTIDAHIGRYAYIDHGTGAGQIRKIIDNDATSLTLEAAYPWTTTPTTASHYQIVTATLTAEDDLYLTKGVRPEGEQTGYAVKYDYTNKTAYIAPDEPLTVRFQEGILLPELIRPIGMTVYRGVRGEVEAAVVDYNLRYQPPRRPAAYMLNRTMYLIDPMVDWREDDQIEFWYVPVPPALTALTDTFLLPDAAKPYLVYEACTALEDIRPTGKDWAMKALAAKESFLRSQVAKVGVSRVKEVW